MTEFKPLLMYRKRTRTLVYHIILIVVSIVSLTPVLWGISGSLQSNQNLFSGSFTWVPPAPQWHNYAEAWHAVDFGRDMINSFTIAVIVTVGCAVFSAMAGYSIATFRFRGRRALFAAIIGTLLLPFPVILIPVFIIAKTLGMIDTYVGVILPGLITPQAVFLMVEFFRGTPHELLESGRVDGASEWAVFRRIALPMAWPIVAAVSVLTFVASWNNLLWPLVVIQSQQLYTVPLGLAQFNSTNFSNYVQILAMSIVAILPVIVLFVVFRKKLVDSIMMSGGALK